MIRRDVYFVSGVSRFKRPVSASFTTPYANTGFVSEHAANTDSVSTGSFVPVSFTPKARRHASRPSRTSAIDTAGSLDSWSHFGMPFSQYETRDSRNASVGRAGFCIPSTYRGRTIVDRPSVAKLPFTRRLRRSILRHLLPSRPGKLVTPRVIR